MNSSTERSVIEAPERLTWSETGAPARSRSAEQLERPADDPAVELLDHPERSAASMKAAAGSSSPLVAGHPQQQLVALDPAGGEARGSAGVCEAQAIVGERVADPRRGRLAALAAAALGSSGSSNSAIRSRPSSLARYIAWSAATSTASAPASALAAEHRDRRR